MNPAEIEENSNNFRENSDSPSNTEEKVAIFQCFEAQSPPKSLFSRDKCKENTISLQKVEKTLGLRPENKEKLQFSHKTASFFEIVRVFDTCRKFIKKLKELRISQSFPLEILGDKAHFPAEIAKKQADWLKNCKVFKRFSWKMGVNFLRNRENFLFDLVVLLILLVVFLEAPLKLANFEELTLLQYFGDIAAIFLQNLCFFGGFMTIIASFFRKSLEEKRKFQINYAFSLDFLAKLSLLLYFFNESCALLFENNAVFAKFRVFSCIFVLLSAKILIEKFNKFEYFLQISRKSQEKLAVFKLILSFLWIIHNFSCFYLYLSQKTQGSSKNEPFSLYLSAFSLIINAISSIPSEIATPFLEKLFFLAVFFGFWLIFIANCGKICRIVKKINENSQENCELLRFLARNHVKYSTALIIEQYFRRKFDELQEKQEFFLAKEINELPPAIKLRVLTEKYLEIVQKLPFLQHFSSDFQKKFLLNLEEKRYFRKEIVMKPEEEPYFLLIDQGSVNISIITHKNEEKVIKTFKKGEVYGEKWLFSLNFQQFSVVAQELTVVKAMKKSDFLKILKENSTDYEKYCFLRDKVQLSAESTTHCEICSRKDHHECFYKSFLRKTPQFMRNFRLINSKNMQFSGRKREKNWNSLVKKEFLSKVLAKNQIIPAISLYLAENKSIFNDNESSSAEFSETSLGQMLKRKLKRNSKEKPIDNSNFSKKPELLLEHINEESEVPDTFTILEFDDKCSDSVKIEEELVFDNVNEFAHYFSENNVSRVLISMRNSDIIEKNSRITKKKRQKIAIKTTIKNKKN